MLAVSGGAPTCSGAGSTIRSSAAESVMASAPGASVVVTSVGCRDVTRTEMLGDDVVCAYEVQGPRYMAPGAKADIAQTHACIAWIHGAISGAIGPHAMYGLLQL